MPVSPSLKTSRVVARLPSGEILDPGERRPQTGPVVCPGPNQWGSCPTILQGQTPACRGAEWIYLSPSGTHEWELRVEMHSAVCPAASLDPLGPLPVPGD